jgi:hypothetical protein
MQGSLFWRLESLSDGALLDGLNRVVGSGRMALAELLAHLCEVEERRLHLDAGYSSMFAYCVARLGLSEDEAYRRIEVARLARRAPLIFTRIAEGRLSLSAAVLLRSHLLAPDLNELIEIVSDKSVQAAREALACRFPRVDVPASVRKLPAPPPLQQVARGAVDGERLPLPFETAKPVGTAARAATPLDAGDEGPGSTLPQAPRGTVAPRPCRAIEPLAAERYKVQFTADAAFKAKLDLARDLMRHSVPAGDLGVILHRALDMLVADVLKRRFGARARGQQSKRPRPTKPAESQRAGEPKPAAPPSTVESPTDATPGAPGSAAAPPASQNIGRAVCRGVLERDGLRCTWHGEDGTRCSARAWLERDHINPRALGGDASITNVRHLCRAHNRRAAEHAFGRRHVEQAIQRQRTRDREASTHDSFTPT